MVIPAAPVRPATKVRTPRPPREVVDTVEVLFAKVLEVANQFQKESDQARARKWGQSIVELQSGDTQPNRRAMRFLLKQARQHVAFEAEQAKIKADAKALFDEMMAPVSVAWMEAQSAWYLRAKDLSVDGHQGQLAVARAPFGGKPMFVVFASLEARIERMSPQSKDTIEGLLKELDAVESAVLSFQQSSWCATCGAPTEEIVPKNGKPAFVPKLCGTCFHKPVATNMPAGKKNGKPVLEFRAEPLSADEIKANRITARALNEANRLAKKSKRRTNAEASANASQDGLDKKDGAAKKAKDQAKEARAQGDHPGEKGKGGKKKDAVKGGKKESRSAKPVIPLPKGRGIFLWM
ncbi:MAG: hypothetical protein UX01_C0018G0013 [Candidatus Collierbacteria bacterium GW2011_GWB2_45_17]|uniref:Uncharacterized protein n=1 Tax=Candidatus Collierbacteria bacterium GW2011_GWB2_45_17 TaxID=1618388 RepID=A0A837IHC8_9BACT|nr:MAG: hypothetical protein UX01_C0018G0013 [Candidatus Collierbacteria bacterium GW2011_GWB2_45_17]HBC44778.1 hypothetical protein [Candidatus Collierbacteria bacterium]